MHSGLVVLVNQFGTGSGGVAQARDLLLAARSQGLVTHVGIPSKVLNCHCVPADSFAASVLPLHPKVRVAAARRLPPSGTRSVVRELVKEGIGRGRYVTSLRRDQKVLRNANLVLSAANLSFEGLQAIRTITAAPIYLVHSGSPDAFIDYWVGNDHVGRTYSDSLARYKAFLDAYDGVLLEAESHRTLINQMFPSFGKRLFVIRPAANEKLLRQAAATRSPFAATARNIVLVGTIQARKNQVMAVEVLRRLLDTVPDAVLHLVGGTSSDVYETELRTTIESAGLSGKVRLYGHREDYAILLAHADAMLQTSKAEGVSRAVREAMFLRVPIVATRLSGTEDTVTDGVEALLVDVGDAVAMARALEAVLTDRGLAERLGEAARQRYDRLHAQGRYANQVVQLIATASDRRAGDACH